MSEAIVIVQKIGLLDDKKAFQVAKGKLNLPVLSLDKATVALVHKPLQGVSGDIRQFDSLVTAQPNELGLKFQDDVLQAIPFSSNPLGRVKKIELRLGETARIEWRRHIQAVNILTHMIVNLAVSERDYDRQFSKVNLHSTSS